MSWKSPRDALKKAFDYAKENKAVTPDELTKKFGITKSESIIIIEWLFFGQTGVSRMSEMAKDKNSEVKGTPADVKEALKRGIISEEEAEKVLEQMRRRNQRKSV